MIPHTAREVGLLRTIARTMQLRPTVRPDQVSQDYLRAERIALAWPTQDGLIVILQPGGEAFSELAECLVERSPAMERGTIFANVRTELVTVLRDRTIGRDPATIGEEDVISLHAHFDEWFARLATPRRVFVPCVITPWAAPRFSVGPVDFVFIDEATRSEFYPPADDPLGRDGFDRLIALMRENRANWLACVCVEGCEQKQAEEIGDLAADLAMVALQIVVPQTWRTTRTMGRLDARRGGAERRTLSEANGHYAVGVSWEQPGSVIGTGTLADILTQSAPSVSAVGACIASFASARFRFPNLERAWCDAAYWFHEALAEPIDAIAIAKLETALEVLLRAESTQGSQRRMETVLQVFYGLSPTDPLNGETSTTAAQFGRDLVRDRSRILHGTWSTLASRLALSRDGMEEFVGAVIRRAALELAAYAEAAQTDDDTDAFLAWIAGRVAATG